MKTQTIVTDITHEDLVNLFCTATYGSEWLSIGTPTGAKQGLDITEDDCREDVWAKVILAGKYLFFYDYNAEDIDEHYGDLPHRFTKNGDGDPIMRYEFTLEDIENGIAKCLDLGGWEAECARDLIEHEGDLDLPEAEAIMQVIIFGETIYG